LFFFSSRRRHTRFSRDWSSDVCSSDLASNGQQSAPRPDSLVLLVQSEAGYRNLLRLVSRAFLETEGHEQPQIALEALDGATEGLLALSGGPGGVVDRRLLDHLDAEAGQVLTTLERLFPGRLYIEVQHHGR